MIGPQPLWDSKPTSPVKRLRIASRRTQLEASGAAGCSLSAYENLEVGGGGSGDLWERVAASFGVSVAEIKPSTPVRAAEGDLQMVLPGASSS